jgi:hypothetical protein
MKKLKQLSIVFDRFGYGQMRVERFGPAGFAVLSNDESLAYDITRDGTAEIVDEDLDGATVTMVPAYTVTRDLGTYGAKVAERVHWRGVVGRIAQSMADQNLHHVLDEVMEVHR